MTAATALSCQQHASGDHTGGHKRNLLSNHHLHFNARRCIHRSSQMNAPNISVLEMDGAMEFNGFTSPRIYERIGCEADVGAASPVCSAIVESSKACGGLILCDADQLECMVRSQLGMRIGNGRAAIRRLTVGKSPPWRASSVRTEGAWSKSLAIMAETVKLIDEDDDDFMDIRPSIQRRHTMAGSSSTASDHASDHAPVVWRAVMPTGRRSTLVTRSGTEDFGELRSTIDGSMRTKRSISDTTSLRHNPGDKATFALHDVDAFSFQRAKVIRRISQERYIRFRNFFKSYEPEMAMEIQARSAFSREHLDAWVNYIVSPKVLRCISRSTDTQQELLDLLIVSAAISKYGESELMAKDRKGDLKALQNIKLHTYDEYSRSRQQKEPMETNSKEPVAMEFVVRINERLSEERRVGGVVLREILTHASTMQIAVEKNNQSDGTNLSKEEERLKQIVLRVQSEWFQDAILKANGRYLYDAIRQVISNVSISLWDAPKDKAELARIQKSDRLGAEVKQIERKSVSERRIRPSGPPPPPPRPEIITRDASTTSEAPLIPSPINASAKVGFTIYNRSSSVPVEEIQEIIVGTDKTRRKLMPLGTNRRPRGLPPKLPQSKSNDPIVHSPSAFIVRERE